MRIIISPAKKMKIDDAIDYYELPFFLEDTNKIKHWMQSLSYEEAKALWGCNDKIAIQNHERFQHMNLDTGLTPAILSYEGIQYQYMAPAVFEEKMLSYVQENLRIISGFYGVLKPMDGVVPYRLEMQAKAAIGESKGLYDFWGRKLYDEIVDESRILINLASKEYSKCIEAYLKPEDQFITCIFGELQNGKVVQKGTYAKMARGEMVRYMAEQNVKDLEGLKEFKGLDYQFSMELSTDTKFVYLKSQP